MSENGNSVATAEAPAPARLRQLMSAGEHCVDELRRCGFDDFDEETNVMVLECANVGSPLEKHVFRSNEALSTHLNGARLPSIRIVSIPQFDSYEALEIGTSAMETLIRTHDVSSDFLSTLLASGWPPRESEEGFGHAVVNRYDDSSYDLTYLSRYYEKRETSWKLRQTGVYHSYTETSDSNLYILLHPREDSILQAEIEKFVGDVDRSAVLHANPLMIHEILFQSYIGNWRLFLKEKGSDFLRSAEKLFALDYKKNKYLGISFEKLQWWRDLEDHILPTASILQATLDLLGSLDQLEVDFHSGPRQYPESFTRRQTRFFKSRQSVVKAFITSASGLQKRIHGAVSLLRDTLELKNQEELQKINANVFNLQRENVDDNETVRVITILTLIYLPGSFVASLFGTNLFLFNPTTSKMRIADNAWWYLVLFVPLMIGTIWTWLSKTRTSRHKRKLRKLNQQVSNVVSPDGSMDLQILNGVGSRQSQIQV